MVYKLTTLCACFIFIPMLFMVAVKCSMLVSGDLKRVCEIDLGIVSQCCCAKQVFKMNKQILANLALKINVKVGFLSSMLLFLLHFPVAEPNTILLSKVGGRNTVLVDAVSRRIPLVTDRPTIIFGADVTHPHPGEDSSPSIAAVS